MSIINQLKQAVAKHGVRTTIPERRTQASKSETIERVCPCCGAKGAEFHQKSIYCKDCSAGLSEIKIVGKRMKAHDDPKAAMDREIEWCQRRIRMMQFMKMYEGKKPVHIYRLLEGLEKPPKAGCQNG